MAFRQSTFPRLVYQLKVGTVRCAVRLIISLSALGLVAVRKHRHAARPQGASVLILYDTYGDTTR